VLNEPNWTKALSTRLRDGIRGWTGSAPILWVGKRSKCRTVAGGLSAFCHDPLHDRDGFGVLVVGVVLPEQFVPRSALIGPAHVIRRPTTTKPSTKPGTRSLSRSAKPPLGASSSAR
jgi:hypothetical protein